MADETMKKQGMPNWADCATTDLKAAEDFYAVLFGWASEHVTASDGAVYSIQRLDGKLVAGIYELNEEMRSMGVPPHWGTYIEVDDVATTLGRVEAMGGTVIQGPFEEAGVGTIGIIRDAVGAYVRLWHSAPQHGGEIFNVPGAMIWNELNTKEPEKAAEFYEELLGVEAVTTEAAPGYTLLELDNLPVAGILKSTPEMGDPPPSWDVYFGSDDIEASAKKAVEAGGSVLHEPFDVPGARMVVLQDPFGAVFEVIKMDSPGS